MSEVERSDDGRYIIVGGRRWRSADPDIPDALRQELVDELMGARRAVKTAHGDEAETLLARERVQNAKLALGERGEPWWEPPSKPGRSERITAAIMALLTKRGAERSICPSEVARIVGSPEWRPVMDDVRSIANNLVDSGLVRITQGDGEIADLSTVRGPVRIRLANVESPDPLPD